MALAVAVVCAAALGTFTGAEAAVVPPNSIIVLPTDAAVGEEVSASASGAACSDGHPIQYQFDWGVAVSGWLDFGSASYVYTQPGTHTIRARARCQENPNQVSVWAIGPKVVVCYLETVSPPDFITAPLTAAVGIAAAFTIGGSASDLGGAVEYHLDWGDGSQTDWLPPDGGNQLSASHTFTAAQSYTVTARARSALHHVLSLATQWGLTVSQLPAEQIGRPYFPDGPSTGSVGDTLQFTAGGAQSNLGHTLEYQFQYRLHGQESGESSEWSASGVDEYVFPQPGTWEVLARARCSLHNEVVSAWSEPRAVIITGGSHTVTPSVSGEGSVTIDPQQDSYDCGEQFTLTAIPAPGWRFHHWEGDVSGNTNPLHTSVCADSQITAVFVRQGEYTLQVTVNGSGEVRVYPSKPSYVPGETVALEAIPALGQSFEGWSGDLTGTENPAAFFFPEHDMEVEATFVAAPSRLLLSIYPPAGGSVTVTPQKDEYAWGEVVQLTATPNAGYVFNHWGGDVFSTENPVQVSVTGLTRIKAIFQATSADHYPVPPPQQSSMSLVGGLSLCGLSALPGDELAVKDAQGNVCGQFTIVDPEGFYGIVKVWGDDPATPQDEGAAPGDPLTFVLWDSVGQTEVELEAVSVAGRSPVLWTAEGGVQVVELATVCQEQVPLHAGWNLISFRTNRCYHASAQPPAVPLLPGTLPVASPVSAALGSIAGHYRVLRGFDTAGAHSYDPSVPAAVNDLTYLAPGYGYWIKASEAATLLLEGGRVLPSAPLQLAPGWNLVGCWAGEVRHVGSPPAGPFAGPPEPGRTHVDSRGALLPSVAGKYDVLRSFDTVAHTYDPLLPPSVNDLDYVGPGYGYWLRMREGAPLSYGDGKP
jgi:hypothetical protein